jgi:hypothetical protein
MNYNIFRPTDPRFYYYTEGSKHRLYYYNVLGYYVKISNIPCSVIPNIKEYNKILKYENVCNYYTETLKELKPIVSKLKQTNLIIEIFQKEINVIRKKNLKELNFTIQDLEKHLPEFFYYTIKTRGVNKGDKTYYDYRRFLSARDRNIINVFNNRTSKKLVNPIEKTVSFEYVKTLYNEINTYQSKYIIISKIISLNSIINYKIKLTRKYSKCLLHILKLQDELSLCGVVSIDDIINANIINNNIAKEYREQERLFRLLYNDYSYNSNVSKYASSNELLRNILKKHNISNKKEYRMWAIKNHPDKGGDTKTFQEVNEAFRILIPK